MALHGFGTGVKNSFPRQKKFSAITIARNRYTTLPMPITEKRQKEARLWCEATLGRIYYDYHEDVLGSLKRLKHKTKKSKFHLLIFYVTTRTIATIHCIVCFSLNKYIDIQLYVCRKFYPCQSTPSSPSRRSATSPATTTFSSSTQPASFSYPPFCGGGARRRMKMCCCPIR